MAASFSNFVGLSKAAAKSNPTQPAPMLTGSETTRPSRTGAGIPIETTSYVQSAARSRIRGTIASGVRDGPEAKRRSGAPSAEVRAFTCEPPTSMPRIVLISVSIQRNEVDAPLFRLYPAGDSPRGGDLEEKHLCGRRCGGGNPGGRRERPCDHERPAGWQPPSRGRRAARAPGVLGRHVVRMQRHVDRPACLPHGRALRRGALTG